MNILEFTLPPAILNSERRVKSLESLLAREPGAAEVPDLLGEREGDGGQEEEGPVRGERGEGVGHAPRGVPGNRRGERGLESESVAGRGAV